MLSIGYGNSPQSASHRAAANENGQLRASIRPCRPLGRHIGEGADNRALLRLAAVELRGGGRVERIAKPKSTSFGSPPSTIITFCTG